MASILFLIVFACAVFYVSQHTLLNTSSTVTPHYAKLHSESSSTLAEDKSSNNIDQNIPEIYAKRLGILQAEAIRLKAITKQLANLTGFDLSQYVFDSDLGQGGIEQDGVALTDTEFNFNLTYLSDTFEQQLQQLEVMQIYAVTDDAIASTIPSRRPINTGWLSSHYGKRVDPFNGKMAFHHGIDFAGQEGDAIYAVADGLVSWTGNKSGYGKTIEIDHGNGYVTRYAHSKELLVKLGDRVSKDQEIALMGSTGRSTGPHVHFELLVAGHKVNPNKFIKN
ncbi:MAG: M23 family metallopeptidase [Flavobacteriaceae bacterium]|nr:M23 family metallopeptidase [Flavobacteriaceae bacterium]PHS25623.1 MAG: peptidase M23 [Methylophaga sp.]